ncbi:LysR family transcriptional regulator [Phenylobacterium immobile]|uniref:LysR family transcriptional regulator n=1 Tax=Phenylobacterium immobile TaxID=21 RepID=UPI000A3DCF58|nr:LysR family transcriptional regulator [Phenylobacterium immobile]
MDLKRLRYFVAVADAGGFTRAAQQLNMSQPPLSRRVHELETELGVSLIDRGARPLALTQAGKFLLEQARMILARVEGLELAMKELTQIERPFVRVAAPPSAIPSPLPSILRRFREVLPQARVSLIELNSLEQIGALKAGLIDVGFGRVRIDDAAVHRVVLREEPLLAAVPTRHRLATLPAVSLADLAREPFAIFPNDTRPSFGGTMLTVLADHGLAPSALIEVRDLQTAMTLVAAGEAVSLAPDGARYFTHPDVTFRALVERVSSPLILSSRVGDQSAALEIFVDVAHSVVRDAERLPA